MTKTTLLTLATILLARATFGQGSVNFANLISGYVNARVYFSFGDAPAPADDRFVAQLWAAAPGGNLVAVSPQIPFRSSPAGGPGYFVGQAVALPMVPIDGMAEVKMVAWSRVFGSSYAQAMANGVGGESPVISVQAGGGLTPPTMLLGLEGFTITALNPSWAAESLRIGTLAPVPEPGVVSLAGLGLGTLAIRRRR